MRLLTYSILCIVNFVIAIALAFLCGHVLGSLRMFADFSEGAGYGLIISFFALLVFSSLTAIIFSVLAIRFLLEIMKLSDVKAVFASIASFAAMCLLGNVLFWSAMLLAVRYDQPKTKRTIAEFLLNQELSNKNICRFTTES